tara:strand:- start:1535 stop:2365 length:831 start_codon:yes stop_codon:yes gene_type:complete
MVKENRNFYQSLLKDINKGFKRIYWFNYLKLKSIYYNSKKIKINKFNISVLYPTRERSKKFERMLESLVDNCLYKDRINLLLLFDSDEPELDKYKNIINNKIYAELKFKIYIKDLKNHATRNNYLANLSNDQILFPVNDDIVFKSKNWDKFIDEEFSKINIDKPYCLWPDTGQKYPYFHSDFPIINKAWYNKLGYLSPEIFNHWYFDTWICDLSIRSKKFHITPNIKIYQYSAHSITEEIDATHLRNSSSDKAIKDKNLWKESIGARILDSKKLLN